ncbi:hypothetical protein C8R44DRAFT_930058 [Mycena epipterygia]|nr:hypothetical protein C8R44DRAFT_930058 [Mycena epipterygia]
MKMKMKMRRKERKEVKGACGTRGHGVGEVGDWERARRRNDGSDVYRGGGENESKEGISEGVEGGRDCGRDGERSRGSGESERREETDADRTRARAGNESAEREARAYRARKRRAGLGERRSCCVVSIGGRAKAPSSQACRAPSSRRGVEHLTWRAGARAMVRKGPRVNWSTHLSVARQLLDTAEAWVVVRVTLRRSEGGSWGETGERKCAGGCNARAGRARCAGRERIRMRGMDKKRGKGGRGEAEDIEEKRGVHREVEIATHVRREGGVERRQQCREYASIGMGEAGGSSGVGEVQATRKVDELRQRWYIEEGSGATEDGRIWRRTREEGYAWGGPDVGGIGGRDKEE